MNARSCREESVNIPLVKGPCCGRATMRIPFVVLALLVFPPLWSLASGKIVLADHGRTGYKIVLTRDASDNDRKAATVLRQYIQKISGVVLPILPAQKNIPDSSIWIGSSGHPPFSIDWSRLEDDGFRIATHNSILVIAGGKEKGTLYAVYTLLERYLGCRKFSPDVVIIPKKSTVILGDIDDTEVPKIKFRMENFYEPGYADWHKLDTQKDEWGLFVHTFRQLVPPEQYFQSHPEYFSLTKGGRIPNGQLCLSNPDVFKIVVDGLRERMKRNPTARYWSVSQNDTFSPCECDSCRTLDSLEGSPSGSILAFVNKVADQFPDKIISTLAYQYSRSAPKHIRPRKNVNIMLCSIECNRSKPLEADSSSASFVRDVREWTNLTDNIFLWDYVIQFRNLVSPFPNFAVLQPNIQFFAKNGITSVFEQGLGSMKGEFAELRTYLIAKLLWNPSVDADSVITDFLVGYYGQAAPHIRKYIDVMHNALRDAGEDLQIYGYPMPSANGYLSAANIDTYNSLFDRAEAVTKNDPSVFERVQTARLPLQFAMLEQAKVFGTADRGFYEKRNTNSWEVKRSMSALLDTFVVRCKRAGIQRLWEHGTSPDEYLASTEKLLKSSMKRHLAMFKSVTLEPAASTKYHLGEASALTDGLRGSDDYHMNWLGFEGEDLNATIDLGAEQSVQEISVGFLQDINSWIFMPTKVEYALSNDGKIFRNVGDCLNSVDAKADGVIVRPFEARFPSQRARFVRVLASNIKTCPNWHKGAGGLAWIFADEIVVE